jgi:hypothetical protein
MILACTDPTRRGHGGSLRLRESEHTAPVGFGVVVGRSEGRLNLRAARQAEAALPGARQAWPIERAPVAEGKP